MSTTSEALTLAAVIAGAGAGAAVDLYTRRVPNVLTVSAAVLGLTAAAAGASEVTLGAAFAGFLLGLALMLPGHLAGGTGGGDVKLMGALGAWLGPSLIVKAFVYSAIAGGVLALIVALNRGRVGDTLCGAARLVAAPRAAKRAVEAADRDNRFPYAPAIAAGSLLAALGL